MTPWLDAVSAALDAAPATTRFFFRDDDAGWDDEGLDRLLDVFERSAVPLDLAVIPHALTPNLARGLIDRKRAASGRLGLHQHGFRHCNHETKGRKCEFGPSRAFVDQITDIAAGSERLMDLLGEDIDPIFTPPWNRCGQITVHALVELGFAILSRDATAAALEPLGLVDLPVAVDWLKPRQRGEPDCAALGARLAACVRDSKPVGLMLHHATLCAADYHALRDLLHLLQGNAHAQCLSMRAVAECA